MAVVKVKVLLAVVVDITDTMVDIMATTREVPSLALNLRPKSREHLVVVVVLVVVAAETLDVVVVTKDKLLLSGETNTEKE